MSNILIISWLITEHFDAEINSSGHRVFQFVLNYLCVENFVNFFIV